MKNTTRITELKKIIKDSFKDNSVESAAIWARARKELSKLENE